MECHGPWRRVSPGVSGFLSSADLFSNSGGWPFSGATKAIPKRSLAFFKDCRRQYGAAFFVLYAHKTPKGVQVGTMDFTKNMAGDGRSFTSKMKTEIAESGIQEIWEDYANASWPIMEAEKEAGIT